LLQSAFDQGARPVTLAQAAEAARLSRPAVVTAREQLQAVLVTGREASQTIALDPSLGVAIAVEVRLDELAVLVADLVGESLIPPRVERKPLDEDPRETLERAAALIETALDETGRGNGDVVGLGLGLPHPVDPRQSGVARALNSSEDQAGRLWEGMGDVRRQLRQRLRWSDDALGLDGFIADSDANFSAFGEARAGALRGVQHGLYLHWADGIRSALIVRGEVDRGAGGVAGAIGHMPAQARVGRGGTGVGDEREAERCPRCGLSGCLEMAASGRAILGSRGREYSLAAAHELATEAADESSAARQALEAGAFQLGQALGTCLNVLNPEAVVIGGPFGHAVFDLVRNTGLEEGLRNQAVPAALEDVNVGGIHKARHGADSAVRGAVTRVLWEMLPAFLARKAGSQAH
jgi:predicted NBD/HSP70 family sugar kinase